VQIQDDAAAQGDVTFRRGQIIANRYTVIDLIGRGGMGCIYRVHDNTLDEEVALKTLLPQFVRDKLVVDRFYNEARIARQLSHTGIVRVHDIGFAGNVLYISMEYLRGRSLRGLMDALPTGQRLPIRTTLKIIDELCESLEYAHHFTVHRDIKPENVMIANDGSVKLMDFGISKLMTHNQLTAVSMVMGTPYYMSPEQLKDSSSVDARADIYSVGVLLYEMLTGNLPTGLVKPASQTISGVPATLDPIVARCVEPEPKDRFASVRELREALRPIRQLIETGSSSSAPVVVRQKGPSPVLPVLGLVLAVAILAGAAFGVWSLENRRVRVLAAAPPAALENGAAAPVADDDGAELEALGGFVSATAEKAAAAAGNDEAKKALMRLAAGLWAEVERLRAVNDPEALTMAWGAAQCYAGVLGAPEGMTFIPPGLVPDQQGAEFWVDGFFMDRTKVTNGQFAAFCGANNWPPPGQSLDDLLSRADVPVTFVSFFDAQAYAAAAGKSIPTYAQWVRATVDLDGEYPWGDAPREDGANTGDAGGADPVPPGSFEADRTGFGCEDMAGNIREWTSSRPEAGDVLPGDDAKALLRENVLVCGGSYGFDEAVPSDRALPEPTLRRDWSLGFRCAWAIPRSLEALRELSGGSS
jgi:formylglycine-generating enzyme required for sulfatase activity/tRNA A-37 threonylcarbamoyl transferase component Bud32